MLPENLSDLLWGPYTVAAVMLSGLYLGVQTRFFYMRHPRLVLRETLGGLFKKPTEEGQVSPFKAMSIALGGTMGTGNITGVAIAIALGGPGALVWMWLSALSGMVLKYAETTLAMDTRRPVPGGYEGSPMAYMKLVPGTRVLSGLFAAALLCSALVGGNMVQTNAAAAMGAGMGMPALYTGLAVGTFVLILSFGGIKRVADALSLLVPFMTITYLAASIWAIYQGRSALFTLLWDMILSAFGLRPISGGLAGYTASRAMRFGMARGLFSNEAGFGTAPIAHAASSETRPAVQGLWGVLEVAIDTLLCCTATALVVLLSPHPLDPSRSGAQLTADAFGALIGPFFEQMVALFTIIFAVTSILGWYVYGEAAVKRLLGSTKWAVGGYRALYALTCVVGAVMLPNLAWQLTDISSFLMIAINLPVVLLLTPRIRRVTLQYLKRVKI
jgi:AGCS family alanine or glycine:cation symporter